MKPTEPTTNLADLVEQTLTRVAKTCERQKATQPVACEVGTITAVTPGVATVSGLPGVAFDEMVRFGNGMLGLAGELDEGQVGCIVLGDSSPLAAGTLVERMRCIMQVPVGDALLGRVIDAVGNPLDDQPRPDCELRRPIERPAPPIMARLPVTEPLQTGIKVVDALIPIGRGQRQLIVGDRQTGKTALAVAAMINQRQSGLLCIYCAIGQRGASVARVIADLRVSGALAHTVVVVAEAADGPGLQYLAPYAACTIGEHFMEHGREVLVVYDDLGAHARAYRELSLLLRRPPGREAFPGDIFYLHSRLLERATRLRPEHGGGSLTALPIVETEAQNISGYIPTNVISITDGQIYLSPILFQKGILPAVDVGKSVSRVGGKAQLPAYRSVASDLKLSYSQFEELEMFSRFGTRLDEHTRQVINHGRRIRHCLKQGAAELIDVGEQIAVLLALTHGLFDPIAEDRMGEAEQLVRASVGRWPATVSASVRGRTALGDSERRQILQLAGDALGGMPPAPVPVTQS